MKIKLNPNVTHTLIFFGIILGIECPGRIIVPPINVKMSKIEMSVIVYRATEGKFPVSLDKLADNASFTLEKEDLIDPWGEPFGYEYTDSLGDGFILWSSGPDRKTGTADDIVEGLRPLVEDWKVRHDLPVDRQGTNTVQKATPDPVPPPVKDGGTAAPGRIERPGGTSGHASPDGWQNPREPVENKRAPWQLLSLIGIVVICGMAMIWRQLKRKKR